jgi:hypothetical protein
MKEVCTVGGRGARGERMLDHDTCLIRLAFYVPTTACIWGSTAFLIAPTQWTVLGPSVTCGLSFGVLASLLLSLSSLP